jgi:hypothetical protein
MNARELFLVSDATLRSVIDGVLASVTVVVRR